jgi:hypothetical protein
MEPKRSMTSGKRKQLDQSALTSLVRQLDEKGVPAQDFAMRIDVDGTWYHQGSPIKREGMVRLFASILTRLDNGEYWLVTPVERGRIEVEDVPFVVSSMVAEGGSQAQQISFVTNIGDVVPLDLEHPLIIRQGSRGDEPRPYILVRGGLEARLGRSVFYELADLAEIDEDGQAGIWSYGHFFSLLIKASAREMLNE